jgi:hypothetical protein
VRKFKFNSCIVFLGINIYIHSDCEDFFNLAVDYFHCSADARGLGGSNKRIDFILEKKKTLARPRWDLDNWDKQTYILESWSRDIAVRTDYRRGIIRSCLSSQCKFPKEVMEELLIFRPLAVMLSKFGFFVLHAGCVAKKGQGIIISSAFGKGKTVATLELIKKGFKFLSDEYVLLRQSGKTIRAYAFPQKIGIKSSLLFRFAEFEFLKRIKFGFHRKKRFWIDQAYSNSMVKTCVPRLILFPNFVRGGLFKLRPVSKAAALMDILKDRDNFLANRVLVFARAKSKHFQTLSALAKQSEIRIFDYCDESLRFLARSVGKILKAKI